MNNKELNSFDDFDIVSMLNAVHNAQNPVENREEKENIFRDFINEG